MAQSLCSDTLRIQQQSSIAEAIYNEGIAPSNGCERCKPLFAVCGAWVQSEAGDWISGRPPKEDCRFSEVLLRDTIVGLLGSGNSEFWNDIHEVVDEYCLSEDLSVAFDGETIACALAQLTPSLDKVVDSEMMRTLMNMTYSVWQKYGRE